MSERKEELEEEYYDPLLETLTDQVMNPDSPINGRDQEEELLGVAIAPPTPEKGGSMLAMDPDQAQGEGSRSEGVSMGTHPVCDIEGGGHLDLPPGKSFPPKES